MDGGYSEQTPAAGFASVFFWIATDGGSLAYELAAPTREAADRLLDERLKAPFQGDANDTLYQWEASRDYDASKEIQRIKAPLLAINSADDERNPPETGIMARELARLPNARCYLIPASGKMHGHETTGFAAFWRRSSAAGFRQFRGGEIELKCARAASCARFLLTRERTDDA